MARGQSALEFAVVVPALVLMVVIAGDFARAFYTNIALTNAARAGAQYGSSSPIAAADANGMKAAALQDGTNVSGISASASQCTCESGTTVAACASSYCTNNPQATYVEVDTQATFNTILHYPGIPNSMALSGKAIMQVQQ